MYDGAANQALATPPQEVLCSGMFEPSRFAQQCLQDAYAYLIPIVH